MARPLFDSQFIFGIHEPGGEQNMLDAGRPGWIVFTEGIGHDPNAQGGRDYRGYSDRGIGVLARLNNGYHPQGTIPTSNHYADFARRCANFVANSHGCKIWIIGNEMNYDIERPRYSAQAAMLPHAAPISRPENAAQADEAEEVVIVAEDSNPLRRWWRSFLATISGGMGDAELGKPTPPPKPPAVRPPAAAPVPPDPEDPYYHGSPARFSALAPAPAAGVAPEEDAADQPVAPQAAPSDVEVITPAKYVECYRLCRDAILSVPGHAGDQVLIGAVAPWNNQTAYPGNERGDWVTYMQDILEALGPEGCDGVTIHTYTHASNKDLIYSDAKMSPPFADRHYEFRAYQDFMAGIPRNLRHLPVYLTETDQDVAWLDRNIGWIQAAYGEIDHWNRQPGNQQIRTMILYRWPKIDKWYIDGKSGVIEDFRQSLQQDYQWRITPPPPAPYRVGDILATRDVVNMRRTPGYRNKPEDDVIASLPEQSRVRVVDGMSQRVDELVWWRVKEAAGDARQGWLAQYSSSGAPLVRRVEEGAAPPPDGGLEVGSLARTLTTVRLRRTPGYVGKPPEDTIAAIPADTEVAIADGPKSADGLTWWEVRGRNSDRQPFTGWMAESAPGGERLLEKTGVLTPPGTSGGSAGGRFEIGDRVVTLDVVRFRRSPGYQNKPTNDVLADLSPGAEGPVVGGPRTADELVWWNLRMPLPSGGTADGWAAETAPNGVTLLGAANGAGATGTFRPGGSAITQDVVRFRRSPGYAGKPENDVIADIPLATTVTIVSGPQSADGLTWWQVDAPVDGRTARGWMAETAPSGATLLAPVEGPPPESGTFRAGELIQAQATARVRNSPGYQNKPADDVLGAFEPKLTLNIIEGPQEADGLRWYRVGGIAVPGGELIGWVAQSAPDGVTLLSRASRLPGTDIPNQSANRYLAAPFRGSFGIAQLWGERPGVYAQFTYDGVPLRGHNGIDFLTPVGTELQAVDNGVVLAAVLDDPSGFGNYILLRHAWGESLYAHMDRLAVQPNQTVSRGQLIGTSGNTGNTEGPHLHFAIRINPYARTDGWGGFSDPLPYLSPDAIELPDYVLPPTLLEGVLQTLAAPLPEGAPQPSFAPGMNPDQPGVRRP